MYGARPLLRLWKTLPCETDRGSPHLARKNVKAGHGSWKTVIVTVVVNCDLFLC